MSDGKLGDFLGGFLKVFSSKFAEQDKVLEIVKNICGITLTKDQIEIKNGVLSFKVNSMYKNEFFLKKDALLKEFKSASLSISIIRW